MAGKKSKKGADDTEEQQEDAAPVEAAAPEPAAQAAPAPPPKVAAPSVKRPELPIEGDSKWVGTMRKLAAAIFLLLLVIGGGFHFLTEGDSFIESKQLAMVLGGIVGLLVLEYIVFLTIVIPRQADYGRYVIHREQVEYYPLISLGLSISSKPKVVKTSRFMGVMTGRQMDKKSKVSYAVYLVHMDRKGKTINVESFPDLKEAERYAALLGSMLNLKAVSGTHKSK